MKKRIERLKFVNTLFYIFSIIFIISIQLLFELDGEVNTNVIGLFIFINSYLVSFYIIYDIIFTSFFDRDIRKISKTSIVYKYILFVLVNIFLVNKITFNLLFFVLTLSIVCIATYDNINFNKFYKKINLMLKENNLDIKIEQKDNRLKAFKNSKTFKSFQLNILNFISSMLLVYIASLFTDFNDWTNLAICFLLFTSSLLLGFRYCFNLSKFIQIKWFEYIYFELFYGLALILLYFEMKLFLIISIFPLFPMMRKETKVRKTFLIEQYNKKE